MKISREFKVGIFMSLAIAILYFGYNYLKGIEFFENTNKYLAKYENVGGLTVSNPVTISGYSVGRVSNVSIIQSDSNKVLVELDINGNIVIGEGATAVLDIGLLGETQIIVEAGDITKPLESGAMLESRLGTGITEALTNSVTGLSTNLQTTIARINVILDKFTGSSDKINNMMDDIEATTHNVRIISGQTRTSLTKFNEGYTTTIENLNSKIDKLDPVLEKYAQLADSLKSIQVQPTLDSAQLLLSDIRLLVNQIKDSEGTLSRIIEDPSLFENLNTMVQNLDTLLIHMNERPNDFFAPLGKKNPKWEPKDN